MTREPYLTISFRREKPLAGYVHIPHRDGDHAAWSRKAGDGLVVDYAPDGRPIGIEIVSPSIVTVEAVNDLLAELHQDALSEEDLSPLLSR